jgi:[ribosomal protein S5]-alanine N-acetyltransferase
MSSSASVEIRPFAEPADYEGMVDYFLGGSDAFLRGMGVDPALLPTREAWLASVLADSAKPDAERDRIYVAWLYNGRLVGHSSVNNIRVGVDAHIHLHLWEPSLRKEGLGMNFFRLSVNYFMRRLNLQRLLCTPYAENPAPNRVLEKLGFTFVARERTIPGTTHFEQDVNVYEINRELA